MKVAEDKPIKINKRKIDRNTLLNSTISLTAPEKIQFFLCSDLFSSKKKETFYTLVQNQYATDSDGADLNEFKDL